MHHELEITTLTQNPNEKTGSISFKENEKREFTYWVLNISDTPFRSPLFSKHLISWDKDKGVGLIGVVFKNGFLAWSLDAPRHTSLEKQENQKAVARIQTTHDLSGKLIFQIHATDEEIARKLASFVQKKTLNLIPICP